MRTLSAGIIASAAVWLAACSTEEPLPVEHAGVTIWNIGPAGSTLRQSEGGLPYRFTAGGEHRGTASLSITDAGQSDVQIVFPDYQSLKQFSAESAHNHFDCGSQRSGSGVEFACSLDGRSANDRITASADSVRVLVPARLFAGGRPVRLLWLESPP